MIEFTRTGDPRKDRVLQYIASTVGDAKPDAMGVVEIEEGDYDMGKFTLATGVSFYFDFEAPRIECVSVRDAGEAAQSVINFIHGAFQCDAEWAANGYHPAATPEGQ